FTYETLTDMLKEISMVAKLLGTNYENPQLNDVKKNFSIFYMCPANDVDYISGNNSAIPKHISVVIDFYNRFVTRLTTMMENNPNTNVISIMGP
ncbi:MAG: hypothetical protein ACOYI4_07870, partial [Christensenellales bacterium]